MNSHFLSGKGSKTNNNKGFSLIELLVVILVMSLVAGVAFMGFASSKKYAPDDQAMKMLDILQEARQRAINQRSVMRVEVNNTKKQVRLIDENSVKSATPTLASDSADDLVIKTLLFDTTNVVIGVHPTNVSTSTVPVQTSAIPEIAYAITSYPLSTNDSVFTMCFLKDGSVVQTLSDASCPISNSVSGAVIRGATIYVYSIPNSGTGKAEIIRAVTVNGISASASVYKCQLDSSKNCTKWIN